MNGGTVAVEDVELVRACARGDERALVELHDRHSAPCRRRALEILRSDGLADEAVQDAFLTLWRTAAQFDARRAQVRTWLFVLVHRRAVDIARREARHHLADGTTAGVDPASYTSEEIVLLQLDRRRVQSAVRCLRPAHRQVIELAYWGGLSQAQIAEHCGIPPGTVKSRTFEALARLADSLAASEPQAA
jgi:RNA polymerase sigma-70 factor (ECF subfamily)